MDACRRHVGFGQQLSEQQLYLVCGGRSFDCGPDYTAFCTAPAFSGTGTHFWRIERIKQIKGLHAEEHSSTNDECSFSSIGPCIKH